MESCLHKETLRPYAAKYIWWKSPDEALLFPDRIIAQVMNLADYDDVTALLESVGEDQFRRVLAQAEAGTFSAKSWAYWQYRLNACALGAVPPLPLRRVA